MLYLLADTLGRDIGAAGVKVEQLTPEQTFERNRLRALLATGLKDGWLIQGREKCGGRRTPSCISVGRVLTVDADVETADVADVNPDGAQ